tara:strand:+ start:3266 stop:3613 length:348 start_codon:yes stop_codon:yes gene_type:complete
MNRRLKHFKDGKLHIYVRTDKYNGKIKSDNWVGRTYIQGSDIVKSSGTSDFNKAKQILFKWYDELQFKKKHNIEVHKRDWLERELDKHNHKLELVRTILPIILLVMQTIIMIKIF